MAGYGATPKEPHRRARRNVDQNPTIRLQFQPCDPPELPLDREWHPVTRHWWRIWQRSPMAQLMGEVDWAYMLDTALMHHEMWSRKAWTLAAEVRLRVAQFGSTPADRLKLRIQWADADQKDALIPQTTDVPNRERYGQLKVMPPPKPEGDAG